MALQASGAISLANIQTEFGGANPISMSEYYRNGGLVTSNNTNVPTSGQISVSQFYSAVKDVIGQVEYTTAGTFSWVCPAGVTSVCAVAIGPGGLGGFANGAGSGGGGGGGLGWKNNIPVVPGNSYTVVVGSTGTNSYFVNTTTVRGNTGGNGGGGPAGAGGAGGYVGDGGGNGGGGQAVPYTNGYFGGGGGAGGYTGAGGTASAGAGTGGGAAAGLGGALGNPGYGGGGVGLLGQGANGTSNGQAGSGGSDGNSTRGFGGNYGGAGGGYDSTLGGAPTPGVGAVRIIWGSGRAFPSTNTGNL